MSSDQQHNHQHYVYIYYGKRNEVLYVGKGRIIDRAFSHLEGSHNKGLSKYIKNSGHTSISVAGPFGSAEIATAVEAALISATSPKFNIAKGQTISGLSQSDCRIAMLIVCKMLH